MVVSGDTQILALIVAMVGGLYGIVIKNTRCIGRIEGKLDGKKDKS